MRYRRGAATCNLKTSAPLAGHTITVRERLRVGQDHNPTGRLSSNLATDYRGWDPGVR